MQDLQSYDRPSTLEDALAIVSAGDVRIIAGCTDVFPATERKTLSGQVLDITGIPALRGVTRHADGLSIGATTTWSDLIHADLPASLRSLQLAAREVGAKQIQNRGTVAGNLCNASPAADGVPPLLTLDASVDLASIHGTRRMALSAFLQGPRQTARAPHEILSAIHIPQHALGGDSDFRKLGARDYLVISIAMVAVRLEITQGRISQAALAVGSCGPVATRLAAVEQQLIGAPPEAVRDITDADVAASLSPIDDVRADAGYRLSSAAEVLRRTAAQIVDRQGALA